jgi:hypothetical protein
MKNSSRLLAEIERNRSRSSTGWFSFSASSSTRRLKCSQESSRLMNRSGLAAKSGRGTGDGCWRQSPAGLPQPWIPPVRQGFATVCHDAQGAMTETNETVCRFGDMMPPDRGAASSGIGTGGVASRKMVSECAQRNGAGLDVGRGWARLFRNDRRGDLPGPGLAGRCVDLCRIAALSGGLRRRGDLRRNPAVGQPRDPHRRLRLGLAALAAVRRQYARPPRRAPREPSQPSPTG